MNFYSRYFLTAHITDILEFYRPGVIDPAGGYCQNFYDDGRVFDTERRHLVSSTRLVVNFAQAWQLLGDRQYLDFARHGLEYLEQRHWLPERQAYVWTLDGADNDDLTQQAYGYAFVLLAYARSLDCGVISDSAPLARIYDLLEQRFWQADYGLYADEISASGVLSEYRGQNANMHLCEAMIAAYEASRSEVYLDRAMLLAENICRRQAALSDGLVWEHYTAEFSPDWDYNKADPKNLYRPWGFQPGHQTEWAKLLLMLHRHRPRPWLVDKARELFDRAFAHSWDEQAGGLVYGFAPDGSWCDDDKYFWVQAESFAAAALLYQTTGEQGYLKRYQQIWHYSWQHLVDHRHGAWFRLLDRHNRAYSPVKSEAGAKCDYHTIGACLDVLRGLA